MGTVLQSCTPIQTKMVFETSHLQSSMAVLDVQARLDPHSVDRPYHVEVLGVEARLETHSVHRPYLVEMLGVQARLECKPD